jgi:ElaB/YqjD/DUF883 family membrane-anchored ribosome-binding protein
MSETEKVNQTDEFVEQSLIQIDSLQEETPKQDFMNDFKVQAEEYSQKLQDAAVKAKEFANEKFAVAGEKFKELQNKDPKELIEDAKEYARQKPGQTILISAAVGLVVGIVLKSLGGKK